LVTSPTTSPDAESDLYFGNSDKEGGFGKFFFIRELTPIDHQIVHPVQPGHPVRGGGVRSRRWPVACVSLPDPGTPVQSLQVIDEDHYTHRVIYSHGDYPLYAGGDRNPIVLAAVRILVDPDDPADMTEVHALQDAIVAEQEKSGSFEDPGLGSGEPEDGSRCASDAGDHPARHQAMFGTREDTDPVRHLIGNGQRMGRQPGEGRALPHDRPAAERRHHQSTG
jgi:hypothetical protein